MSQPTRPLTVLDVLPPKINNKQDFSKPLSQLDLIPVEYPIVGDVCEGCYFNGEPDSLYAPFACQFPGDPTAQCSVPAQGGTFDNFVFVEKAVQS